MALSQTQISELFVAVFGRASEGDGVTYFGDYADQATAANAMFGATGTDVVTSYFDVTDFTSDVSITKVIKTIFKNALGRDLDTETPVATQDGASDNIKDAISYFLGLAKDNTIGYMVEQLIAAANLESHQTSGDPLAKAAQDQFKNMVEVSNYVAATISKFTGDFNDTNVANGFLSTVTSDPATVTSVKSSVESFAQSNTDSEDDVFFTLTSADLNASESTAELSLTGVVEHHFDIL